MRGITPPLPPYVFMTWFFVNQNDNFIFTSHLIIGFPNNLFPSESSLKFLNVVLQLVESTK